MLKRFRAQLEKIPVKEVPKNHYGIPAYGMVYREGGQAVATIREDLSPQILKEHVKLHERIHAKTGYGEIRTNLLGLLLDPRGFSVTALKTLADRERRSFYREAIIRAIKKRLSKK